METKPTRGKTGIRSVHCDLKYTEYDKRIAISKVKYGLSILKLNSRGNPSPRRFYLLENNSHILQWISPKKPPQESRVHIQHIWKIEINQSSTKFRKKPKPKAKGKSASIYYGSNVLDLIFKSEEEMMIWLSGILYLIDQIKEKDTTDKEREVMNIQHVWSQADRDLSGGLDIDEVRKSLIALNIYANEDIIQRLFIGCDADKNGIIDQQEFDMLMDSLLNKPELDDLYMSFASTIANQVGITRRSFCNFLKETQRMQNITKQDSDVIFQKFCEETPEGIQFISKKGFRLYMFSPNHNSIFSQDKFDVHMDMTQPLQNYYIDSSHNTYLEGNQLTGTSSVEQYSKTLFRGCRCVEIDIWDGPNGNPKVTHGRTLVNHIEFRSVVETINMSAFNSSPYPIILSLENHCSFEQQGVMADIFLGIFGDKIYIPEPGATSFPSPEELKYKILIKGKVSAQPNDFDTQMDGEEEEIGRTSTRSPRTMKLNPKLISLISIEGQKMAIGDRPYQIMSSVTETKMKKMVEKYGSKTIIEYHKKNLTRIYPAGSRVSSTNYNPVDFWLAGCQVCALNYQKGDLGMLLNYGWFQINGGTGYVLKPNILTDANTLFDPNGLGMENPLFTFEVEVISAHGLPKSGKELGQIVNPYVEIKIHGIEKDQATSLTSVIQNNGFNPIWNEEFTFSIRMLEMSMVSFRVYSKSSFKNRLLCQFAIPINCVRNGYRVIPLIGKHFFILPNTFLLIRTRLTPIFSS
ncbi:unnamed protein product [Blepharisma stoltei]|uniref:Phosphoinositide phospholipase C n=1 Tax=Blepharisma stoltei TaxID=1481888 RepID=A0AAU9J7G7_9CILI|nr:unnamed protein product [Blepharisma stoltei]